MWLPPSAPPSPGGDHGRVRPMLLWTHAVIERQSPLSALATRGGDAREAPVRPPAGVARHACPLSGEAYVARSAWRDAFAGQFSIRIQRHIILSRLTLDLDRKSAEGGPPARTLLTKPRTTDRRISWLGEAIERYVTWLAGRG